MDFAALMSKEISKARPDASKDSKEKFLKRSEFEAQRQATYQAEQRELQRQREERELKKRKREEDDAAKTREREEKRHRLAEESRRRREEETQLKERARRKRLGLPEVDEVKEEVLEPDIAEDELITKLREMNEPARLFGESYRQRLRRYQQLLNPLSKGPIPTSLHLVPEAEMKVSTVSKDAEGRKFLFRQLASYFTMVLEEWAAALDRRPLDVRESFQGKAAYNAMIQSRENMRPLFKKFERGEVEDGVLEPVVEIVKAAQEKRYVDANDGYLRLSIGKA
jgi:pre-mRNA-splicing factor 18